MKLAGREAARYPHRPDPSRPGLLIYGADAITVARRRDAAIAALVGPDGIAEMRLDKIAAADLRNAPGLLADAVRARGFFPGPRAVLADGLTDAAVAAVGGALDGWQPGDAVLVVTAGTLPARSKLRTLFERHSDAVAAPVYDDPPDRAEIAERAARAGLRDLPAPALAELEALAETLDPGAFTQTLETLALYLLDADAAATPADVAAVAPLAVEAGVDDLVAAVADGRGDRLGPLLARLSAQGIDPVTLAIAALRHIRQLHAAAAHPGGPAAGIAALRPPVFGPRRTAMERQAASWNRGTLETALGVLVETDLALRSGGATAPSAARMARALYRVAALARRRPRG